MTEYSNAGQRLSPRPGMTIGEACTQASSLFAEQAILEPRANAERLILHLLGLERAALLRDWHEPFPLEHWGEWAQLAARKAAGEPVQYLTGEQWFYGLPFAVTPAVLIPRPETELLVEAVLAAADRLWPAAASGEAASAPGGGAAPERPAPTVADVGTGSGAIAVTLAAQRPRWRVLASDLSADALAVARANAARLGAAPRIAFAQGDLLGPFLRRPGEEEDAGLRIDILVSNPPYIPAGDIAGLQPEVRDHEPRLALDGGADGLQPYRRMLEQLPRLAVLPRIVAFELGRGQAPEVAAMLRAYGAWDEVSIVTDYAGIERHVIAVSH